MSTSCHAGNCVVVFGTASLQRYIFQSNRLRENIGASYLAKHWLNKRLIEVVSADRRVWDEYETNPWMDQPEKPVNTTENVNLIYVGGGNAALLCKSKDIAKKVVGAWSRKLLKKAPGLRVVVGYGEVSDSLTEAYRVALDDLNQREEALLFGTALHSLPVVRTCTSTGLPASKLTMNDWISQVAACKQDAVGTKDKQGDAQKEIAEEFSQLLEPTKKLPKQHFAIEFEDLGGYEGKSHIAVVHADGNEMGKYLIDIVRNNKDDDDIFLHHLRAFSASVTQLSGNALRATLEYLKAVLPLESLQNPKDIFPLRPIVYGGDDLTFVCDGRLGLNLAAFYLREFASGEINIQGEGQPVDACAGVAIVPTKFPFARAYGFADELCGLAKARRRDEEGDPGSWLDFQIIQEGATSSITVLRDVQYRTLEGASLTMRPYQVPKEKSDLGEFKWNKFIEILETFQRKWPRSRAKELLKVLTQGPALTQNFIDGVEWRKVKMPSSSVDKTGWTEADELKDSTTPYFDPLEALDFYIALDNGDTDKGN